MRSVPGVNVLTTRPRATTRPHSFAGSAPPTARAGGSGRSSTPPDTTPIRSSRARPRPRATRSTSARATTTASSRCSTSPSPGRRSRRRPIWYLENGFQTTTAGKRRRSHYSGRESVARTLEPEAQAAQIAAALRLASCQPRVAAYFNFLLVDESALGGWQSGLLWADWQRKPAFEAYRAAIAEVRERPVDCAAALRG